MLLTRHQRLRRQRLRYLCLLSLPLVLWHYDQQRRRVVLVRLRQLFTWMLYGHLSRLAFAYLPYVWMWFFFHIFFTGYTSSCYKELALAHVSSSGGQKKPMIPFFFIFVLHYC